MSVKSIIKRIILGSQPKNIVTANISLRKDSELLAGKIALITGGSSGFGYAIAKRFLDCGAKVIITGRNQAKLEKAVKELDSANAKGLVWDLCNTTESKTKYTEACSLFGPIDIAINNAGVWTPQNWANITEEVWNKVLDTNLKGLLFICQAEGEAMIEDAEKMNKIINITSIEGVRGGFGPYFASKWGANGLTRGMAKALTSKNVVVNAIAPGMGITDINPNLPKDGNLALDNLNGRFVAVEEVAELALFLASDASNSIVGQVIAIDGGMALN